MNPPCGKRGCKQGSTAAAICRDCDNVYRRCDVHGGLKGALRSLKSHRGVYHSKTRAT